jgi:DNA-directed RNA polymerase subunit beta'
VGRVLLWDIVPRRLGFDAINKVMDKKSLGGLIDLCYRLTGEKETVLLADRVRSMGYTFATRAGISIALKDMIIPAKKAELLEFARNEVAEIENQYNEGLITDGERYNKVIDIWAEVTEKVAAEMMQQISQEEVAGAGKDGKRESRKQPSFNPIFIMADSGARGSAQQIRQLAGMRGLMAKPSGEIIRRPSRPTSVRA